MQANQLGEAALPRFSVLHRLTHLLVMVGFTMLALTGMSLAFSSNWIAKWFILFMGGQSSVASVHRFFAIWTYFGVVIHLIWFAYYKLVLKGRFTGPHSIWPRIQDFRDFIANLRYFLGRRSRPPEFNRFTYMEKIEYWAIFIGMNTMGLTGLFLWSPEWMTQFFPGYFVNIARILHLYEAILAVVVKLVIHIGMAHFRPAVFPMDRRIFSGKPDQETD